MEKKFVSTKKFKIIVSISAFVLMGIFGGLGGYFLYLAFSTKNENAFEVLIISLCLNVLICLPFIILSICGLIQVFGSYVILDEQQLEYSFGCGFVKKIGRDNIKYWYFKNSYFYIFYTKEGGNPEKLSKVKIENIYDDNGALGKWLKNNCEFKPVEFEQSFENEFIESDNLSPDDEKALLEKFRKISNTYNRLCILLCGLIYIIIIFIKSSNIINFILGSCVVISLIGFITGIFLLKYGKGYIRFDEVKEQTINIAFDNSNTVETSTAKIIDISIKNSSVTVSPWHNKENKKKIESGEKITPKLSMNSDVIIEKYRGFLFIPHWKVKWK